MDNNEEKQQEVSEKIRDMAKLSLLTNKINEIQEKNLKVYGFIFFEGVREAKIDYDFSHKALVDTEEDSKKVEISYKFNKVDTSHFRISYNLTIDDQVVQSHIEKRFDGITKAVRALFWKDVKVQVAFNDKLVFESENVRK